MTCRIVPAHTDRYWLALYYCDLYFQSGKWKVVTDGTAGSMVWMGKGERL
jgi:hypothetical protein